MKENFERSSTIFKGGQTILFDPVCGTYDSAFWNRKGYLMAIKVQCACGKSLSAKDEFAGRRVRCPGCQQPLLIPAGENTAEATTSPIATRCSCGEVFQAKPEFVGKTVKCPQCSRPVQIPDGQAGSTKPGIEVICSCGHSVNAPPHLTGKRVRCPACQNTLAIPEAVVLEKRTAATDDEDGSSDSDEFELSDAPRLSNLHDQGIDGDISGMAGLLDELGIEASKTGRRCPNCGSDVAPEAVLCIDCGYNLETGKQLKPSSFVKAKELNGIGAPPKKEKK